MPTFKHPCPHCGTFINRDVAACPACGRADPFAPARCPNCRAALEDPDWIACPACGKPVGKAAEALAAAAAAEKAGTPPTTAATTAATTTAPPRPAVSTGAAALSISPAAPESRVCAGCRAPLPAGARFCRECGTAAP